LRIQLGIAPATKATTESAVVLDQTTYMIANTTTLVARARTEPMA